MKTTLATCAVSTLLLSATSSFAANSAQSPDHPPTSDKAQWYRHAKRMPANALSPEAAARAHLKETLSFKMQGVALVVKSVLPLGSAHTVRFIQRHEGVEVLDSAAVVRVNEAGQPSVTVLQVARGLTVATSPSVDNDAARSVVGVARGTMRTGAYQATLTVQPTPEGGRLLWKVDVPSFDGGHRYFIDADDGSVLAERGLARHALGRVYRNDAVTTPDPEDLELTDLLPSTPQLLTGWNGNLTVTNYVSGSLQGGEFELSQSVQPSSGDDFLYDPPANKSDPDDAFSQVGIYYHLTRIRDFFSANLEVDMSDSSWKLTAIANVRDNGQPVDNAFFGPTGVTGEFASPNMIGIGQGSVDFADDSDVFLHEFTHYVNHNAIGFSGGQTYSNSWGLSPFGGSIGEGISDYFACTVNGNPILGESSLGKLAQARDLTDTSKSCPGDMFGEVHADGEIIGSFAWTLRERFGAEVADKLVWGATALLAPGPSFGDFGNAILQTADDLIEQGALAADASATISSLMAERGLDDCGAELSLSKDDELKSRLYGLDILGQAFGANCAQAKAYDLSLQTLFHYEVKPEDGDERVRFSVKLSPQGGSPLSWGIYVRKNEHVAFERGSFLPKLSVYDYSLQEITGADGELVIDETSDPPFDPAASYHMVLVHQNCPNAEATITTSSYASTTTEPGPGNGAEEGATEDADPTDAEPMVVGGGCGCRVVSSDAPTNTQSRWAWLLAGLALMGWRRRNKS